MKIYSTVQPQYKEEINRLNNVIVEKNKVIAGLQETILKLTDVPKVEPKKEEVKKEEVKKTGKK